MDTVLPPAQLVLAHLRASQGHLGGNTRHVYPAARQLSARAVGGRRRAVLQGLRGQPQHAHDCRTRLRGDTGIVGAPRQCARRRLCHGASERDGILGRHTLAAARRCDTRRVRRRGSGAVLAHCCGVDGQRRGQLFPFRMAALPGRRGRQARRVCAVVRNRHLQARAARCGCFRGVARQGGTGAVGGRSDTGPSLLAPAQARRVCQRAADALGVPVERYGGFCVDRRRCVRRRRHRVSARGVPGGAVYR